VKEFFVIRADCGEGSAARDGFVADEIVGAESDATAHGLEPVTIWCPELFLKEASGVEFLEDVGAVGKIGERIFEFRLPFFLREVGGDHDAA